MWWGLSSEQDADYSTTPFSLSWRCTRVANVPGMTVSVWLAVTRNTWDLDTFLQISLTLKFSGLQLILLHHRKVDFGWSEVNVWSELWFVSFLISIHNLICIDEISAELVGTGKWRKGKVLIAPPTLVSILKTNDIPVVLHVFTI